MLEILAILVLLWVAFAVLMAIVALVSGIWE